MARTSVFLKLFVVLAAVAAGAVLLLPPPAFAQEEVASALRRYKDKEASTGYYEEFEVRPRRGRPFVEVPGVQAGVFPYSPTAAKVRIRSRLADSHMGIASYTDKTCVTCHPEEAKDIHTVRANLTCRQCHGGEPIASIQYFNSPMNPIRKHAYVCAKCHPGASASYAAYVVHEPKPAQASTLKKFPVLAYAFWIMVAIAVGTFVLFLPHTFLWGLRELFIKKEKKEHEPANQDEG
jgi:hypothetical protein